MSSRSGEAGLLSKGEPLYRGFAQLYLLILVKPLVREGLPITACVWWLISSVGRSNETVYSRDSTPWSRVSPRAALVKLNERNQLYIVRRQTDIAASHSVTADLLSTAWHLAGAADQLMLASISISSVSC